MAMTNHIKLARDFITAWEDKNLNQILNMMAKNCKYHNIPMQPLEGHDNIKSFIASCNRDESENRLGYSSNCG